jgi:hypothetical protein
MGGVVFHNLVIRSTFLVHRVMVRPLITAVLVSSFIGVIFGLGVAHSFLSVNAWQLESETKSYNTLLATVRTRATNPNAKASIEQTTYHFGVMDVKATGTHDFYIKNVGTEYLILALDRTTCSCTGIDIFPTRVAPGKTAKCHLKYNAEQATTGKFSQGGIIRTNDPDNREIHLIVEGVFTNPVVVQPTVVNFSRVPTGATRTATIRFYGFENEPLQLSAPMWEDREHFDFQWKASELSDENKTDSHFLSLAKSVVEGTITLKPGLPIGPFQPRFQVATNYPGQPNVIFSASGQIVGNVSISGQGYNSATGVVDLSRTVAGKSEVLIRFSGLSAQSATVQIKAVEPDWLRTNLLPPRDLGVQRIFSLMIEVPENAPAGNYSLNSDGLQAHVTLETNDESTPVLKIPIQFVVGGQ